MTTSVHPRSLSVAAIAFLVAHALSGPASAQGPARATPSERSFEPVLFEGVVCIPAGRPRRRPWS
jgi:hypothetical protein